MHSLLYNYISLQVIIWLQAVKELAGGPAEMEVSKQTQYNAKTVYMLK